MKKTTRKVAPVVHDHVPTIIEFLLDETGSMGSIIDQTIAGFQDYINEQRNVDGLCLFTLTKFDTRGQRIPYTDLDIRMVPYLTKDTFLPNACTNLRDSILKRIDGRNDLLSSWDIKPRVLFVCMSDGDDNSSRYSVSATRERIQQASNDGWTFVFLGAYDRSDSVARDLGFLDGNIKCFEGARMQETMQELSAVTKAYRVAETTPTTVYQSV